MSILSYTPPNSSFIKYIVYDTKNNRLAVIFNSLAFWMYYDVPLEIYKSLTLSESVGNYFNNNIRNVYNSIKIANLQNLNKDIEKGYLGQKEK